MISLQNKQVIALISTLQHRFEQNTYRHANITWDIVEQRLYKSPAKLVSLYLMEASGGEPDVVVLEGMTSDLIFCDCSLETPKGRRGLCYDREALNSRKDHKPADSVSDRVKAIGAELLTESQYLALQKLFTFDMKTSSWIDTPIEIRQKGGALFGDYRYGCAFIYHNGASSYYSSRGFRVLLRI